MNFPTQSLIPTERMTSDKIGFGKVFNILLDLFKESGMKHHSTPPRSYGMKWRRITYWCRLYTWLRCGKDCCSIRWRWSHSWVRMYPDDIGTGSRWWGPRSGLRTGRARKRTRPAGSGRGSRWTRGDRGRWRSSRHRCTRPDDRGTTDNRWCSFRNSDLQKLSSNNHHKIPKK